MFYLTPRQMILVMVLLLVWVAWALIEHMRDTAEAGLINHPESVESP